MFIAKISFPVLTAALVVILTTILLSAPVYSGDYGMSKKPRIRSGPTIGPEVQGVRSDNGGPGQVKPGVNTGPIKDTFIFKFTLGVAKWRGKLIQPVWIPELNVFTKPGLRESN